MILHDPEPGWTQATDSASVQQIVDRLEKLDSNAVQGEQVRVAAELWRSPGATDILAITVIMWPSNVDVDQVMRTGLDDECVTTTGQNPPSVSPVAALGGSLGTRCAAQQGAAVQLAVVTAHRGPDVEMVESIGLGGTAPLSLRTLGDVAARQYQALPAPPASTGPIVGGVIIAAVAAGLLAIALRARAARRRSRMAVAGLGNWAPPLPGQATAAGSGPGAPVGPALLSAAGAPPGRAGPHVPHSPDTPPPSGTGAAARAALAIGWHQEGEDPYHQRYWDGSAWTARIHWDGSSWVSAP
ncbi:MAG TPA: hypothetical protein VKV36_00985 [Acidimicrobiales bacterium]|nr:hypothetical protein [Acidimicrobiales bacterium]